MSVEGISHQGKGPVKRARPLCYPPHCQGRVRIRRRRPRVKVLRGKIRRNAVGMMNSVSVAAVPDEMVFFTPS